MPDSPPASGSRAPRIAGLALAVVGAAGLIASAFLTWFTVTPDLARLGVTQIHAHADVSGTGSVAVTATGPGSGPLRAAAGDLIPNDAAWAGWTVAVLAAVALIAAATAAFGPRQLQRALAAVAGVCALAAAGVGAYALIVPVGSRNVSVPTIGITSVTLDTGAGVGPYVVIAAAAVLLVGAIVLLVARRSAAAPSAPMPAPSVPAPPFGPGAQPAMHRPEYAPSNPQTPAPEAAWARPVAQAMPAPVPPPLPAPAPVPESQTRTAVAPVARRRPQPEWDRNWPSAVPPQPGPVTPSQQHTQVVKRPPRPVKVSPKPETEAIPRYDPRYDSPTEPL